MLMVAAAGGIVKFGGFPKGGGVLGLCFACGGYVHGSSRGYYLGLLDVDMRLGGNRDRPLVLVTFCRGMPSQFGGAGRLLPSEHSMVRVSV